MSGLLDDRRRMQVWRDHGADEEAARELLAYARSPIDLDTPLADAFPLPDPPCVAAWHRYAERARDEGAFAVLREALVQLRFPVAAGMSASADYQAATRRGILPEVDGPGLALSRPEGLRVFLHPTPAGRVPVVLAEAREDFEALVRALTRRNEPSEVPGSMGACMVAGYNNWDRVRGLRLSWERSHEDDASAEGWDAAFRALIPQKDLYQDRFMLLSSGPYSGTPAEAIGLAEDAWRRSSVTIRLEHECTHYFTRQAFGSMRKSMLDELVADYMGLLEALGAFQAPMFLRFVGLECYPLYREGGRLQNYRGDPPLGDEAFRVLQRVLARAASALGRLDPARGLRALGPRDKARIVTALFLVGLEGLADQDVDALLEAGLARRPAPGASARAVATV